MSNLGGYQDIVVEAHKAGGTDIWLDTIKKDTYNNEKKVMIVPSLAIGVCLGMGVIILCQKIHTRIIMRKKQKQLIVEKEGINADTIDEIKPNNTDKE